MTAPAPLHGRDGELGFLQDCLSAAVEGDPRLVFVEGDPGMGKSALLQALAARVAPRVEVFSVSPADGERYDPVTQAATLAADRSLLARVRRARARRPGGASLAVDWLGAIPGAGNLLAAIAATAAALHRTRRGRSAVKLVGDTEVQSLLLDARRRPLVLLLDDCHRADAAAVARLEALARFTGPGDRLLLVCAYRPTAPGVDAPPVHRLCGTIPPPLARHLRLGPLPAEALLEWLERSFLGGERSADFDAWLLGCTGGRPGSVVAVLEHCRERGLARHEDGEWVIDPDPDRLDLPDLTDAISDLDALPAAAAELIRVASVLGDEFDSGTLARLAGRDELFVEDQLAVGMRHDLLAHAGERTLQDGEIATLYRFVAPHVRMALFHGLPAARRDALRSALEEPATRP